MGSIDKILVKFENLRQPTALFSDVEKLLTYYGFEIDYKRGSHRIARHPLLINVDHYGADGTFTIPTVKGNKLVKQYIIKRILKAIERVEEAS